jgi:hypothetical protein
MRRLSSNRIHPKREEICAPLFEFISWVCFSNQEAWWYIRNNNNDGDSKNKHNQTQPITVKVSIVLACVFLLLSSLYLEVRATRRASWQRCKKQQHHVSGDCWGKEFVPLEVEPIMCPRS